VPVIWQVDQETFETFGVLVATGKFAPLLRQTLLAQSILGVGGVSRSPVGCRRPLKSICNESAKFRGHRVSSCDNGDWQLTIAPRHTKGWALSCGMPSLSVSGYFQFPIQSISAGAKRIMSTPLRLIFTATVANGNRSSAKLPSQAANQPLRRAISATRPMHKLVLHNHSLLGSQSFAFDAAVKQVLVYG